MSSDLLSDKGEGNLSVVSESNSERAGRLSSTLEDCDSSGNTASSGSACDVLVGFVSISASTGEETVVAGASVGSIDSVDLVGVEGDEETEGEGEGERGVTSIEEEIASTTGADTVSTTSTGVGSGVEIETVVSATASTMTCSETGRTTGTTIFFSGSVVIISVVEIVITSTVREWDWVAGEVLEGEREVEVVLEAEEEEEDERVGEEEPEEGEED